jgi:hypothetical protein
VQTPLSSSTQWDALDQNAPALGPAFEHMELIVVEHAADAWCRWPVAGR